MVAVEVLSGVIDRRLHIFDVWLHRAYVIGFYFSYLSHRLSLLYSSRGYHLDSLLLNGEEFYSKKSIHIIEQR